MTREDICTLIIKHLEQLLSRKRNFSVDLKTHCIEVQKRLIPSPTLYIAYKTGNINVLSYHPGQIIIKKEKNTSMSPFNHEHVKLYHEYLNRVWTPPTVTLNVFMPCTQKKPYRTSVTHRMMLHYLHKLNSEGIETMLYSISEPMLIVPYNLETFYPLSNYDFPPKLMNSLEKSIMIEKLRMLLPRFMKSAQKNIFILPRHHADIVLLALDRHSYSNIENTKGKKENIINIDGRTVLIGYGRLAFKTLRSTYMMMRKLLSDVDFT